MKLIRILSLLLLLPLLASCNSMSDPAQEFKGQSAEQIYNGGEVALANNEYTTAVKHFEGLDALFPFTDNAEQSQLDLIYAYYMSGDAASAAASAERFTHLYPRSEHVDYAYYMKGIADFDQDRGWEQRYFPMALSKLDPGTARIAFSDFSEMVSLFPESRYAPDARLHMVYLRNLFAEYELNIAHFYLVRHAYIAASNRAYYILQNYQQTPSVEGALIVLVQADQAMGLIPEEQQAERVLAVNYPNAVVPPFPNN